MSKKDFDFSIALLKEFFNKNHVKQILKHVDSCSIKGWEKWLQIEISYFLSNHKSIAEWNNEEAFDVDNRKDKERSIARVDFVVRKKGTAKNRFMVWELKCKYKPTTCIRHMVEDMNKVEATKTKDFMRSYWLIGVHSAINSNKNIYQLIDSYNSKYTLKQTQIISEKIRGTNFYFTVF